MAFLVIGVLLVAVIPGSAAQLAGLGCWWFGGLLVADSLLGREGLPAQLLWMAFTSVAVYLGVYRRTGLLRFATSGTGLTVLVIVTVALGAIVLLRRPGRRPRLTSVIAGMRDRAAAQARAARPASAAAAAEEAAHLLTLIAGHIDAARDDRPREAAQLSELLAGYRSRYGMDLVVTSPEPAALGTAVTGLARDMEVIKSRVPSAAAGYGPITLAAAYARQLASVVIGDYAS
ncbi:MAG: hypothetical protein J2P35_06900 [Actinobacteria bacterium]|nr:hypothetical protein [Actinomycetota bacterium]